MGIPQTLFAICQSSSSSWGLKCSLATSVNSSDTLHGNSLDPERLKLLTTCHTCLILKSSPFALGGTHLLAVNPLDETGTSLLSIICQYLYRCVEEQANSFLSLSSGCIVATLDFPCWLHLMLYLPIFSLYLLLLSYLSDCFPFLCSQCGAHGLAEFISHCTHSTSFARCLELCSEAHSAVELQSPGRFQSHKTLYQVFIKPILLYYLACIKT